MLQKRTPGTPLSEAELRQRRDAARSRWENYAAGAAAGAVAGAGLGQILRNQQRRRAVHERRIADFEAKLSTERVTRETQRRFKPAESLLERRKQVLDELREEAVSEIGGVGSSRVGMKGWPVPEYHRLMNRRAAEAERSLRAQGKNPADFGSISVTPRGSVDLDVMTSRLSGQGYEKVTRVGQEGQFAWRGGILDIWPRGAKSPIRIDTFGDEVERIATLNAATGKTGKALSVWTLPGLTDRFPSWRERFPGARPPFRAFRGEVEATRKSEKWRQPRREGRDAAIERMLPKPAREQYRLDVEAARAAGEKPPKPAKYLPPGMPVKPRRRTTNVSMKGNVGADISRAATAPRIQGTPRDEALDQMRREIQNSLKARFSTMRNNLSNAEARLRGRVATEVATAIRPITDRNLSLRAASRALRPKWTAGRWRAAGAVIGSLAGLGAAEAYNRLTAEKVDAGELRKDDAPPTPNEMAGRIARLLRSWYEAPGGVSRDGLLDALAPMRRVVEAQADSQASALAAQAETDADSRIIATTFGYRHPYVERAARERQLKLAGQILDDQAAAIKQALADHALRGDPVEKTARSIRDAIGLTPTQAKHVAQYRLELEYLHPNTLNRALRDHRFDRTVQRALDEKSPIPSEKIDRMVDAYHRRWLAFRAENIARTEAIGAANAGAVASTRAALDQMPDMTVIKTWMATKDDKTRDSHRHLDGKSVIGIDTPFVTDDGHQIRWPHDESAPASEVVRCRCTMSFRLVPRERAAVLLMESNT